MVNESKISIDANQIQRYSKAEAIDFVEEVLGSAQSWAPSLVEFRLSSDSQEDWKTEVGRWLLLARDLGFLDPLRKRLARASTAPRPVDAGTDYPYTLLQHELAAATAAYYFTGIGWRFESWEQRGEGLDIDLRLRTVGGSSVDIQVKASDHFRRTLDGRTVGGDHDEWVLEGIKNAAGQLEKSPGPMRMIVACPQREEPIRSDVVAHYLFGQPISKREVWGIRPDTRGLFATNSGEKISAIVVLGLLHGGFRETLYRCTAFLNPWTDCPSGQMETPAFPHARVLALHENVFTWQPEPPGLYGCHSFRTGVAYVESEQGE